MATRLVGVWLAVVRLCASIAVALLGASEPANAQARRTAEEQSGTVPREAAAIVVGVVSYFYGKTTPEIGAGILFGTREHELYIATAGHVVQRDTVASTIWVKFVEGDSLRATVAHPRPDSLFDLAVLSVAVESSRRRQLIPRSWDRQGSVRGLQSDDPVIPVGCPQGVCWRGPRPPDRVIGKLKSSIVFQSFFVRRGSSGGALFNRWREVVGMVIKDEPPLAHAIPIDTILAQVKAWGFPVALEEPPAPRGGYRTSVGAALMASTSSSAGNGDTDVPSGRVSLERQVSPLVTWHIAGLRLTPDNLAVTAGMAGVGLQLEIGRFVVSPFVEAGVGHVESRFNLGSYLVDIGGETREVPVWSRLADDGIGIGGGLSLAAMILPPIAVEVTTGYWGFTRPDSAAPLNKVFIGAGVRLGL